MDSYQIELKPLFTRLTLLPSIYGVLERIRGMLSSDVFHEIKYQPTCLLTESDLQAVRTTLSDLQSAFPLIYLKLLAIQESKSSKEDLKALSFRQRKRLKEVEQYIGRLGRDADDVEDVLEVAATEQLLKKLKGCHPDLPESEQFLMPSHLFHLNKKLENMSWLLKSILVCLGINHSERGIASVADKMSTSSPGFMLDSTKLLELEELVVGRDSDKEKLISFIFNPPPNQDHPNMLVITGEAGVGKTTLVKLVCKDSRVSNAFDLVLWASAPTANSGKWHSSSHIRRILVEIIQSVTPKSGFYDLLGIESLKRILSGILQAKKYLLILDDFDRSCLELMEIFRLGSTGSTVILISNGNRWGSILSPLLEEICLKEICLNPLPVKESWLLFSRCAELDEMDEQRYPSLKHIGRSMVTNCYGNPLAIKTLGSTLRSIRDEHTWDHIHMAFIRFSSYRDSIVLGISIGNMPNHLMQCFLASAILFEYNLAICQEQLLYFWMAHGLLPSSQGMDTREMVDSYCNELLLRGFLQVDCSDYNPNYGTFQMHKQLSDIVKLMIGEEYSHPYGSRLITSIGRHLLSRSECIFLTGESSLDWARTILVKPDRRPLVGPYDLEGLISNSHLARVLWLNHFEHDMLPDAIGNLKLLRYLSLKGNHRLQVLPNSICKLVNLQTLDLSGCVQLKELPGEMHKLVSLRHLLLSVELTSLPEEALKSWTSLHLLKICYCQHLNSLSEGIQKLTALQVLRIHKCPSIASLPSSIKYLTNLKEISILDCQTLRLTGWEGLDGLTSLQFLQFQGLPNLIHFPVGLQSAGNSLRHLVVSNCRFLKALPECLQKCIALLEVIINSCPSIVALPRGIRSIKTLKVLKIFNCPELVSKCELGKEDWHLISHIPKIRLDHPTTKRQAAEHPYQAHGEPQSSSSQNYINTNVQAGAPSSAIPTTWSSSSVQRNEVPELADGAASHVEVLNRQDEIVMENEYSMFDPSIDDECHDLPKTMDENELSNEILMEKTKDASPKYRSQEGISCCTIFFLLPDDYEFQEDTLIQLWMAAGYIKDELIGHEYFHSLYNDDYLLRCGTDFVTGKERYQINKKVKDLLDDGRFHLQWRNESLKYSNSTEIQHLSLVCNDIDVSIFQTLEQFNKLKTLLFLRNYGIKVSQIPDHLFQSFKELRALDLSRTSIKKLPSSVGCMIRLCYLDLSGTLIEWLPDTICSLGELQTLKLRGCSKLRGLPRQLKKLTKLRHLEVDVLRQLATIPAGIGALVSLRTLSAFLVSTEDGCKIQELKELNSLTGEFCIAMLENVDNADEAKEAGLNKKQHIIKLELRWTASQLWRTNNNCYDVLKCLQPCSSLKELQIYCYEGKKFPDWVGDPKFNQLVSITFFKCEHVSELPLIEQLPFLKQLELVKMNGVKKIECRGNSEQASFPSLEKLEVDEMESLRCWKLLKTNEDDFKNLVELKIKDCPGLREFHGLSSLSSIKHLEVRGCPKLESLSETKLPDSLEDLIVEECPMIKRKCSQQGGGDWLKIQHVPNIRICEDDDELEMVNPELESIFPTLTLNDN